MVTHNSPNFIETYRQASKLIDCYGSHNINKLSFDNTSSIVLFYGEDQLPILVVMFDLDHHLYDYTVINNVEISIDDVINVVKKHFYIDNIVKDCTLDDVIVYYKT